MSGKVIKNADATEHAAYSLDAWNEYGVEEVELTPQLSVKVQTYDVLAVIGTENNPLMRIVQNVGSVKNDAEAGVAMFKDPEAVEQLRKTLNDLMVKVVVSPPLKEAGHEQGLPVDRLTLQHKMAIFLHLLGGEEAVGRAEAFPAAAKRSVES